jgi:signal transduction histidine kinase
MPFPKRVMWSGDARFMLSVKTEMACLNLNLSIMVRAYRLINVDHIFDPFFVRQRPWKGTGLGLSVCYRIIEALGGTIRAESQEERV